MGIADVLSKIAATNDHSLTLSRGLRAKQLCGRCLDLWTSALYAGIGAP